MPFSPRSNPEWCYILGNFGVKVRGAAGILTDAPKTLAFGSVTTQGLAFYGGNITYRIPVEIPEGSAGIRIQATHFRGALVTVSAMPMDAGEFSGEEAVLMVPPYEGKLSLTPGRWKILLTVYGNRFNSFGQVHLSDEKEDWLGADSWRSEGAAFSYEYRLKPLGLLSAPKLWAEIEPAERKEKFL